jgi:hypothetical protein
LFTDALIILRAFFVAGKPVYQKESWGSFVGWGMIRDCLMWLGFPDPKTANETMMAEDRTSNALYQLVYGWDEVLKSQDWEEASANQVVDVLDADDRESRGTGGARHYTMLREALSELCWAGKGGTALPSARAVGSVVRNNKERVIKGKMLQRSARSNEGMKWSVVDAPKQD